LADQSATVKEKRSVVERISRLMILAIVRDSDVLVRSLDKLLSKFLFEFWGFSIDLDVLEVLVELELVELFFLELLEGLLDGDFGGMFEESVFLIEVLHRWFLNLDYSWEQ
jgi:hypothetical protein